MKDSKAMVQEVLKLLEDGVIAPESGVTHRQTCLTSLNSDCCCPFIANLLPDRFAEATQSSTATVFRDRTQRQMAIDIACCL